MAWFSSPAPSLRRFFLYWTRRKTVVFALEMADLWSLSLMVIL